MGSLIHLGVGQLEVDWGKNSFFRSHSALFLPEHLTNAPYLYVDNYIETKPAYVCPLHTIQRRLGLLGYRSATLPERYAESASNDPPVPFDAFAKAIAAVDLRKVCAPRDDGTGDDIGGFITRYFRQPEFNKVIPLRTLSRTDGTFFENLDPYILLRLLLDGPANRDQPLTWRFADVVEGGWVTQEELRPNLDDAQRILVVTEGSSDSSVLERSLPLVAPDIADFFTFIDMAEHYPFTGTGNVFRFCQGLAKIRIQNRVLVVLDNDTAGHDTLAQIRALSLPRDMHVVTLPDLPEFVAFPTLGPTGMANADVNGSAVAIECFLDLTAGGPLPATIRWVTYNERLGRYHGALSRKDAYLRYFLHLSPVPASYDLSKLHLLWDHLYRACAED